MPSLSQDVRNNYLDLFKSIQCDPDRRDEVNSIATKIIANKLRYDKVSKDTGVPWWFIGAIHNMEASLSFNCHLHNGDSLEHRTHNVPSGRPVSGTPPFTWEYSAIDALKYDNLTSWKDWCLSGSLYRAELFNGWGYHSHGVNSPYLWGGSNQQEPGKYVSDGVWDPDAETDQIGVATIWHMMIYNNIIKLDMK